MSTDSAGEFSQPSPTPAAAEPSAAELQKRYAQFLELLPLTPDLAAVIVQVGARTGDAARDVDEDACRAWHEALRAAGIPDAALVRLIEILPPSESETVRAFGESLPEGLRLA